MANVWWTLKILFWMSVFVAFLYSFVTHFILWKKSPLAHSCFLLLKSSVIEFICALLNIFLIPLQFLHINKQKTLVQSSHIVPILFIHGYIHHQLAWFWFIAKLGKQLPNNFRLFSLNLSPPFSSIKDLAKLVQNKIAEIRANTNHTKVILIGHSMGGLLAGYVCEYLAKSDEIFMVITIGSPLNGTSIAAFGIGQNAKEMLFNSDFLKNLNEQIKRSTVPYCSIASTIDNVVIPWQSALLSNGLTTTNHLILNDHGHLRLLISPIVIQQVYKWILQRCLYCL